MRTSFFIMIRLVMAAFVISFCTLTVLAGERSPAAAAVTTLQESSPPSDLSQFPEPIKKYAQMIADLCKTMDLIQQVSQLQTAIAGLRQNLPRYFHTVDHAKRLHTSLFYDRHIGGFWEWLNTKDRVNVAEAFLVTRVLLLPRKFSKERAGPEYFDHTWEHQIYDGLYCYSYEERPPKMSLAKKPDAS